MAASVLLLTLLLLVSLLSASSNLMGNNGGGGGGVAVFPPTCNRIECPSYDVIHTGNGFEIRRYNSTMWVSTQLIDDISLVHAGNTAFYQ